MAVRKTDKANIRSRYPLYVQIGLALSLALVILAFSVPMMPGSDFVVPEMEQEMVQMEDIEQTQQLERPPPPPAPPPPEEVPDEEIIEEQVIDISQDIDLNDAPPAPPPPPPPTSSAPPPPPPPAEPEIFEVVEQMPVLQGGLQALQASIQYPEMARRAGIEGRVYVQFVVDEQGRPTEVRAVRGIGGGCDEAAEAAVRNARFTPGLQRGRPVKVRMSLPINFRLS
ncbi:MAG: energy transducer TonB [Rubricoccaceae bacterium]|nr:energy transducer TonB [Rubricoccaceae bacterium]